MFDIVALGETLIDFTPDGKNTQGSQLYAQNPGGAPMCWRCMLNWVGALLLLAR